MKLYDVAFEMVYRKCHKSLLLDKVLWIERCCNELVTFYLLPNQAIGWKRRSIPYFPANQSEDVPYQPISWAQVKIKRDLAHVTLPALTNFPALVTSYQFPAFATGDTSSRACSLTAFCTFCLIANVSMSYFGFKFCLTSHNRSICRIFFQKLKLTYPITRSH